MLQLDDGAGLEIRADHFRENPLMIGVIAIGDEDLPIVERSDHREVVGIRRETDI
jgi:hypothetical protein